MSGFDKGHNNFLTQDMSELFDDNRYGIGFRYGNLRVRRRNYARDAKFTLIMSVIMILVMVCYIGYSSRPPEIARSTKARTKVTASIDTPTEFLLDDEDIVDDKEKAESSMAAFFKKTGVAPFLIIIGDDSKHKNDSYTDAELGSLATDLYVSQFTDSDHLVILMIKTSKGYRFGMHAGSTAAGFMDKEAMQILGDCLEHYVFVERSEVRYASDTLQGGKAIADAFDDAGERLMKKDMSPYVKIGVAAGIIVIIIASVFVVHKKNKKGKLTVDKEYLPGEYVPPSVVRVSDSDNAKRGVKYNYGSQAVAGDIPMGELLTHDKINPGMDSVDIRSANYPNGVLLNNRRGGALMPDAEMPSVESGYSDFKKADTTPDTSGFLSSGSVPYKDNKGNTVYMNKEDDMKDRFDKWAKDYSLLNGENAFRKEDEAPLGSTSVYHDNKGNSVLLKGRDTSGGSNAANKEADMKTQFDKWTQYYASVNGQSTSDDNGSPLGDEKKDNWLDDVISSEKDSGNNELFHL